MPDENEDTATLEQETPAGGEVEKGAESSAGGDKLLAGKFKTPEALEEGYKNSQEMIERLKQEADEARNLAKELSTSRARDDARADGDGATPAERAKTVRQEAERLARDGKWLDAIELVAQEKADKASKAALDRAAESERRLLDAEMATAMRVRVEDSKRYPHFKELDMDMGQLLAKKLERNPDFHKSFDSTGELLDFIYGEATRRRPDLSQPGKGAAALSGTPGSGSRVREEAPVTTRKAPPKTSPEEYKRAGVGPNPWQAELSPEDLANKAEAERSDKLARVMAGTDD